jgi:hypothetical protein
VSKAISILILAFFWPSFAQAQDEDTNPQTFVWHFKNGLDGDAKTVGRILNSSLNDTWKHYSDMKDMLASKQDSLTRRTDADIQSVRATKIYQDELVTVKSMEADLEAARAKDDLQAALDAGSRCNLEKEKLKKLESDELKNDRDLPQMREFVAEYQKKSTDAMDGVRRAALWRAKLLIGIEQGRFTLRWPLTEGQSFFFDDSSESKVVSVDGKDTTIEMVALQYMKDSTVEDKFGDGINMVTVLLHLVHVTIPTPSGFTASANDDFIQKQLYILGGSSDEMKQPTVIMPLPRKKGASEDARPTDTPIKDSYTATPDRDSRYAVLWNCLNDIPDVPQAVLDKAKADAKAEMKRVLSAEDAKMNKGKN